jgi:arsenate reductase
MITIYHNPRCSKSREGLQFLENSGAEFTKVVYMDNPLSAAEIKDLLKKLNIPAIELVRKNEAIWKENFKGKELSEKEIIQAMTDYPNLIERPIVVNGKKAIIGRPTEKIHEIL